MATFGAGCFWASEQAFREVVGVVDSVVGFMDGIEVVQVAYDPAVVSYDGLLETFWGSHDTSVGDGGERSAIIVNGEPQEEKAKAAKATVANWSESEIKTEIFRESKFSRAPERDQRYYEQRGR